MKYYLGIDGGGTKTLFLLADEGLNILAEYTGPTCHYMQCGFEGLSELMSDGVDKVCAIAGIDRGQINSAFMGCAGYGDTESNKEPIRRSVKVGLGDIRFGIGNDCENGLAGALGGEDGINLIAGTGSMACGKHGKQGPIRCGGWHHAIGSDEGSAYWISWRMLQEFTRQSDGRDERTALYDAIKNHLSIEDDGDLITRVIDEWALDRGKIASLCPICTELCDAGDPYAIAIINDAAAELADMAIAIYKQLGFTGNVKVSGTGGVFNMGSKITAPLTEMLSKHNMEYAEPLYSPAYGALILAKCPIGDGF